MWQEVLPAQSRRKNTHFSVGRDGAAGCVRGWLQKYQARSLGEAQPAASLPRPQEAQPCPQEDPPGFALLVEKPEKASAQQGTGRDPLGWELGCTHKETPELELPQGPRAQAGHP